MSTGSRGRVRRRVRFAQSNRGKAREKLSKRAKINKSAGPGIFTSTSALNLFGFSSGSRGRFSRVSPRQNWFRRTVPLNQKTSCAPSRDSDSPVQAIYSDFSLVSFLPPRLTQISPSSKGNSPTACRTSGSTSRKASAPSSPSKRSRTSSAFSS